MRIAVAAAVLALNGCASYWGQSFTVVECFDNTKTPAERVCLTDPGKSDCNKAWPAGTTCGTHTYPGVAGILTPPSSGGPQVVGVAVDGQMHSVLVVPPANAN